MNLKAYWKIFFSSLSSFSQNIRPDYCMIVTVLIRQPGGGTGGVPTVPV